MINTPLNGLLHLNQYPQVGMPQRFISAHFDRVDHTRLSLHDALKGTRPFFFIDFENKMTVRA
jgi:hypothetical protein